MGRSSGKSKKPNDESEEDGSDGEEVSVSPTPPKTTKRRRGRPAHQKPLTDDGTDDVEAEVEDKDAGELEEEEDAEGGAKPPAPAVRPEGNDDANGATAETTGAAKKRRRRRRRRRARVKRGSDDDPVGEEEDGVGEGRHVRAKSSGFRPNGSRRKTTPRRAAEAGVECK